MYLRRTWEQRQRVVRYVGGRRGATISRIVGIVTSETNKVQPEMRSETRNRIQDQNANKHARHELLENMTLHFTLYSKRNCHKRRSDDGN